MHVNVPQFIDVEDKIAFGLTGKQLLWGGVTLVLLLIFRNLFDQALFFIMAFVVISLFGAFAFWKPQGVTLIVFLGYVVQFLMKPRSYIWRRVYTSDNLSVKKYLEQKRSSNQPTHEKKRPTGNQLKKIAWILDTEGKVRK